MASWNLLDIFRQKQIHGEVSSDLDTVTVKAALVTSGYTPNQNTHDFWDDVSSSEVSGTGYTAGGNAIANVTVSLSGAGLVTVDGDDPATWAQNGAGFNDAVRVVLYIDTGTPSTSPLIAYSGTFTAGGNVDGDFTVSFDAAGIFTSPR